MTLASGWCLLLIAGSGIAAQPRHMESRKNESSVTYRLVHPLHTIEATSKEVVFRLSLDPTKKEIAGVSAQVDVMTFDSCNSNRDSHAMEVIDAISYPDATFSGSAITQYGDSLRVDGTLTFHGVTKNIVVRATVHWSPKRLEVRGDWALSLTAFQVERPSLLMIPVEDTLRFSCTAVFGWE